MPSSARGLESPRPRARRPTRASSVPAGSLVGVPRGARRRWIPPVPSTGAELPPGRQHGPRHRPGRRSGAGSLRTGGRAGLRIPLRSPRRSRCEAPVRRDRHAARADRGALPGALPGRGGGARRRARLEERDLAPRPRAAARSLGLDALQQPSLLDLRAFPRDRRSARASPREGLLPRPEGGGGASRSGARYRRLGPVDGRVPGDLPGDHGSPRAAAAVLAAAEGGQRGLPRGPARGRRARVHPRSADRLLSRPAAAAPPGASKGPRGHGREGTLRRRDRGAGLEPQVRAETLGLHELRALHAAAAG